MANIDKLRKEVADTKEDLLSDMEPEAMEPYIWNLLTDYYYSYVNDDMSKFHKVTDEIAEALERAMRYGNATEYINYCRISILTALISKLFKRDAALEMPHPVSINESRHNIDETVWNEVYPIITTALKRRNETEEEKLKRYADYFNRVDAEAGNMSNDEYVKLLIRPDVDPDFINKHMAIIENILTEDGIAALKKYVKDGGK